jgi:hypothetical protein
VCVVPVPLGDRVGEPLVGGLLGEAEDPAGHRNRNPTRGVRASGEVGGPAGTSFWEHAAGEVGRRPTQDLVLLLQLLVPPPQVTQLGIRGADVSTSGWYRRGKTILTVCDLQPAVQARLGDPKSRAICALDTSLLRATRITSRRNSAGNGSGMSTILPARTKILTGQESTEAGASHLTCQRATAGRR